MIRVVAIHDDFPPIITEETFSHALAIQIVRGKPEAVLLFKTEEDMFAAFALLDPQYASENLDLYWSGFIAIDVRCPKGAVVIHKNPDRTQRKLLYPDQFAHLIR